MKRITTKATLFALCLAALGVLGACSADDAAPTGDAAAAAGGTPIVINVAPKPDYVDVDANGATSRATTDDATGTVAWEDGDRIYVNLEFNDPATTQANCTMVYDGATSQWTTYNAVIPDVNPDGTPIDLSAYASKKGFPLAPAGATMMDGGGFHFDGKWMVEGGKVKPYSAGRGGIMITGGINNIPVGDALTLTLKYDNVCLMFTGLEPGKGYTTGLPYYTEFNVNDLHDVTVGLLPAGSFKAAADGSLVVCASLSGTSTPLKLTKEEGGTVVYQATTNFEHGKRYQCRANSGGIDPGTRPDLVAPKPIIAGNAVRLHNGYFITVPYTYTDSNSDHDQDVPWHSTDPTATTMENDPCAGHGNWRMPTMKDWEGILGWETSWPWSQTAPTSDGPAAPEWDSPLLPGWHYYWSSTLHDGDNKVWCLMMASSDRGVAYSLEDKNPSGKSVFIRCVQQAN